jgi:hypothetical protein
MRFHEVIELRNKTLGSPVLNMLVDTREPNIRINASIEEKCGLSSAMQYVPD